MNKSTLVKIRDSALFIESLIDHQARLLTISKIVAEPSHKADLKSLHKFLGSGLVDRLDPPVRLGYEILVLLCRNPLTYEQVATKIGKSPETIKQAIAALRQGGIEFSETETGKYQTTGRYRVVVSTPHPPR